MRSTAILTSAELEQLAELGTALRDSGFFADTKTVAQAAVKVLAGRELGLGPVESMRALHIVQGKVELSADLLAARVKLHPRYDYRILTLTDAGCAIEFFQDGDSLGISEFADVDRARAKLTGATWTQYPRNMMFARAMSNGVAWFVPDVASGARLYVDGEIVRDNESAPDLSGITPDMAAAASSGSESSAEGALPPVADAAAERPQSGEGEAPERGKEAGGADGAEVDAVSPPASATPEPHEHEAGPRKLASGKPLCKHCGRPFRPVTVHITAPVEERADIS